MAYKLKEGFFVNKFGLKIRNLFIALLMVFHVLTGNITSFAQEAVISDVIVETSTTESAIQLSEEATQPAEGESQELEPSVEDLLEPEEPSEEAISTESSESSSTDESSEEDKEERKMGSPTQHDNVVTEITVTRDGKVLTPGTPLDARPWQYFKTTVSFRLPNNTVVAGDKTVVRIPDTMLFAGGIAPVNLEYKGQIFGTLVFDYNSRTATITYTEAVETMSDITGDFFFETRVDHPNHLEAEELPVIFSVGTAIFNLGNLNYTGVPNPNAIKYSKNAYFHGVSENKIIRNVLTINQQNEAMSGVVITDVSDIQGKLISAYIRVGEWYIDAKRVFRLRNDIQTNIQPDISKNEKGETVMIFNIGDFPQGKGAELVYDIELDYPAEVGDAYTNRSTLTQIGGPSHVGNDTEIYTTAGANIQGSVFGIKIKKVNENNEPLQGAKFLVTRTKTGRPIGEFETKENGEATIGNLLLTDHTITEIEAPSGYVLDSTPIKVVEADFSASNPDYDASSKFITKIVTNKRNIQEISVTATKTWVNGSENRPTIWFKLYRQVAGGEREAVPNAEIKELANGETSAVWNNLPDKNQSGQVYTYSVQEVNAQGEDAVPEDYVKEENGLNVTNTFETPKISFTGTKTWNDANNQDGIRPETVTVQLVADGSEVVGATRELNEMNAWTYRFDNLAKYNVTTGEEIRYTVKEINIQEGYTPNYVKTATGYDIQNTYTPGETSVNVSKVWNDANNQDGIRPTSIEVQLYADDTPEGSPVVLNSGNSWQHIWTGLPLKKAGQLISYTVKEVNVPNGYTIAESGDAATGYTLTNTHEPEVVEVSGTKTWEDANNQDGVRPTEITVELYANNQKVDSVTTNEAANWQYRFTNLPKFAEGEQGVALTYTVKEVPVEGYQSKVTGYDITNTHTPDKVDQTVMKVWNDANNQDGIRPTSIEVQLYANDTAQGAPVTLDATNNWQYTWSDLDKNKDGQAIAYTVKEVNVPAGYVTTQSADNPRNVTITNTHEPEVVEVSGTKTWEDANNQDGVRPTEITVELYANNQKVDSVTTNEAANWQYRFTNLPKFAEGEQGVALTYTVKEVPVEGYQSKVTGYDITNTHTPDKVDQTVMKVWNDANNQDGIRPTSIEVQLYANDTAQGAPVTLDATNNWQYTWSDLDKNKDGQAIAYTVKEVNVPAGYVTTQSADNPRNVTITNTHEPAVIDVSVVKKWEDSNNVDKLRPTSIEIQLYADGNAVSGQKVTLNAVNEWQYMYTNLPKYQNGKEIVYAVQEVNVPNGYTVSYKDTDATHKVITNTHKPSAGLPKTGEDIMTGTTILGVILLIGAVGYYLYIKKRRD